ncbi:isochorismatase family protein [Chloroflexota bacterium]
MKDTDSWQELQQFYKNRGFVTRIGYGDTPAVMVIDFMKAFTDKDSPLGSDMELALGQTLRILTEARKSNVPIIFTIVAYESNLDKPGLWAEKLPPYTDMLMVGSDYVEISPVLDLRSEEIVVRKKYPSAFFGTDLVSRLNALRVDTLILSGCTTSGCVRATVVDGISYGFRIIVPDEAVADRDVLAHRVSLLDIDSRYGDVVSVDSVIEYLSHFRKGKKGRD